MQIFLNVNENELSDFEFNVAIRMCSEIKNEAL